MKSDLPQSMFDAPVLDSGRPPQQVKDWLWVFPPNRDCRGGTAWWLDLEPEPLLIDCPPLTKATIDWLQKLAAGRGARILVTSREGHGRMRRLQEALGWPLLVQEQEAYLLPGLKDIAAFSEDFTTQAGVRLLWTPGPTPGSCVAYAPAPLNVMFCGRLLVPVAVNHLAAIRHRRTFHWLRQQRSLEKVRRWIPPEAMPLLASGGGLGALRGGKLAPWDAWKPLPPGKDSAVDVY